MTPAAIAADLHAAIREGWIEFTPIDGSTEVLVTGVESTQPEREHLVYWATGLTPVFMEGALARARRPVTVRVRPVEIPNSTEPKPRDPTVARTMPPGPEPVLDPFEVGGKNRDILRQELGALNRPRLLNIISAYDLNPAGEDVSWMSDRQLIQFIVQREIYKHLERIVDAFEDVANVIDGIVIDHS